MSQEKKEIKSYDQLTNAQRAYYKLLAERDRTFYYFQTQYTVGSFPVFQN